MKTICKKKIIFLMTMVMIFAMLSACTKSEEGKKETPTIDEEFEIDTYDITWQLSPEQKEKIDMAYYDIVCSVTGLGYFEDKNVPRKDEMYIRVYSGQIIDLDENGVLHGYYGKKAPYLYCEMDESYTFMPLVVNEKENSTKSEMHYTCSPLISYDVVGDYRNRRTERVDMQILVNQKFPNGVVYKAVGRESGEVLPNMEMFNLFTLPVNARYVTRGEDGEMIDFYDWEEGGYTLGLDLDLTEGYRFEMRPLDEPENYYCIFAIKDVNGDYTYSDMIPIQQ